MPRSAKNVGYGGSYTGSVAAYMRLRYPHTFHAVLASSSVVKFLVGTEAWDHSKDWSSISIGNSIAEVASKSCQQKVAAGMAVLQGPLGQTKEGRALIASAAGCASLESMYTAVAWMSGACAYMSVRTSAGQVLLDMFACPLASAALPLG